MANIIGPDVSFYQDDPETPQGIDFRKMRTAAEFVIIRAGQNTWVDSDFKVNWREAKLAGLPRGSYWFYDSRTNPKRQAELWVQQCDGDFGELPLFADLEENYHGQFSGWKHWYDFLERLKEMTHGKEIAIYTAYYYWRDNAPNPDTQADSLEYFHQYPLWIANYGATVPLIPKPWSKEEWLFWQYTDHGDGNLFGVESSGIDLNYFNGDLAAFKIRFNLPDSPTPPPTPPGDKPTGRKYRVTAVPSLKVREGPGTGYNAIGLIYTGEIVEEINATSDRTWLKIRKSDGSLIGWSFDAYLAITDGIPPTPPPRLETPPTPVPEDKDKPWYLVGASSLPVRELPHSNSKLLGTVLSDDCLPALDDSSNPDWAMIRRVDGLTGWCEKKYLTLLSKSRPNSIKQGLLTGITYLQKNLTKPRRNRIHIVAIDLTTSGLELLVTPSRNPSGILCTRTTSNFLEEFNLDIAINGDGYSYLDTSVNRTKTCPNGGDPVKVNGYAASRGDVYSPIKTYDPTIHISETNQVTVNGKPAKPFNAVSGDRIIVADGIPVKNLAVATHPRTGIGLSKSGRWLILMVVDGRQSGFSEGVTLPELADLLISYGAYTGINMDGGGSSTMIIKGIDGKLRLVNSPIDDNKPGKQRAVANHLGLWVKK